MRGSRSASERLAHGVEEPLPHLSRLALAATQLLVHAALLMAQVGRHHHSDDADLIAAPAAAHVRYAQAVELDLLARLRARSELDGVLARHRRHGDRVAEHRLRDAHGKLVDDVLAAAHQLRVRLDSKAQVEVAAGAAAGADLALTGQAQRHVVVDAGRDGDLDHAPLLDATLAAAMGARIVDDVALAAAVRARGHVGHLAEDRLHGATHLTGTSTGRTLRRLRDQPRTRAAALSAHSGAGHVDRAFRTEDRFLERDLDVHAQVIAALRSGASPPSGATAEEHVEEVEGGIEGERTEVRRHPVGGVPERVVALPLLRVAEHRVGLADLFEALLGLLVPVVAVGVVLHRQLAVRRAQLLGGGVATDPEHLVVVALDGGHGSGGRGRLAGMRHAHHRRTEQPVMQAVARHQLVDDGVVLHGVRLFATDGLVDARIEWLADARDAAHAEALKHGLELADHQMQPADEEIVSAPLGSVRHGPAQVVQHREHGSSRLLARVAAAILELLALAPLEVLEIRRHA